MSAHHTEMDQRHIEMRQSTEHFHHVRVHIFAVILNTQVTDPRVEDLYGGGATGYLVNEIIAHGYSKFSHEFVPGFRLMVHKRFCFIKILRRSTFNDITGKGEWRTGKAKDRKST